jgi:hypothetical protein
MFGSFVLMNLTMNSNISLSQNYYNIWFLVYIKWWREQRLGLFQFLYPRVLKTTHRYKSASLPNSEWAFCRYLLMRIQQYLPGINPLTGIHWQLITNVVTSVSLAFIFSFSFKFQFLYQFPLSVTDLELKLAFAPVSCVFCLVSIPFGFNMYISYRFEICFFFE